MQQEICKMMHKGALLHKRLMTSILERYNITYAQYQVLKIINEHPGVTAKEILIYLDTDKATLSGVLTRLEKSGYIERKVDKEDRRLVHVYLTEKSVSVCEDVKSIEASCEEELLKGLKPKEIRHFFDAFNHVINNQIDKLESQNQSIKDMLE
ncbi:MAG: MarR family winged helix-turn-helix transcriptional regulator [Bacillota bacterium]